MVCKSHFGAINRPIVCFCALCGALAGVGGNLLANFNVFAAWGSKICRPGFTEVSGPEF